MQRSPVFDDAQPPGGELVYDAVIEQDHAIRDVFLEAVAGKRAIAALAGDDGRDTLVFHPVEQATQLGAQNGEVGKASEKRFERIQHDTLGADRVDGESQADEKSTQVEVARFLDFASHNRHVVDQDFLACRERLEIETHRRHILGEIIGAFLERHEHARFTVLLRPAHQKLHGEHGFPATGTPAHQRCAPLGESAAGDLVESHDPRCGLAQGRHRAAAATRAIDSAR